MQTITKFFKEENDFLYRRGEVKGEIRGEIKGEIKGEIRGAYKKAQEIALELKEEGFPVSKIAKITKLSATEIEKL